MAKGEKKLSKKELAAQQEALKKQQEAEKKKTLSPFQIHVMPQRFNLTNPQATFQQPKEGGGKKGRVILLIVVGSVILGMLGFGAFMLYQTLNQPLPEQSVVTPQPSAPTPPPVVETPPIVETPETPVIIEEEEEEEEDVVPTPPTTGILPDSVDTDGDGLTDAEERLLGTEIRVPDTDGDGFTDGQEVANLYSPFSAGPIPLADVASINTYTNPTFSYSFLHPAEWLVRPTDQSRRELSITSITGEMFSIVVFDNPENVSLTQWLVNNQPFVNPQTLTTITSRQGYGGVVTQDRLRYYLLVPQTNQIYQFIYDPGQVTRLNFRALFRMMVDSLLVTP